MLDVETVEMSVHKKLGDQLRGMCEYEDVLLEELVKPTQPKQTPFINEFPMLFSRVYALEF